MAAKVQVGRILIEDPPLLSGAHMAKRRGNPNWCNPQPFDSLAMPSAFEQTVKIFKLSPEQYVDSAALKEWVLANKHNKFVPEQLLEAWGFDG